MVGHVRVRKQESIAEGFFGGRAVAERRLVETDNVPAMTAKGGDLLQMFGGRDGSPECSPQSPNIAGAEISVRLDNPREIFRICICLSSLP